MKYTGERVIPKKMNPNNGMLKEHIARYRFAAAFCRGRVLDIASGAGYGPQLLLESAPIAAIAEIVGIDASWEAVNYARWHYGSKNVKFYQGDALDKRLCDTYGTFDTIVSFETIEHFAEADVFLQVLKQLAKPHANIIISTPFGKGRGKPCGDPYHVWQYTPAEFSELLRFFPSVELYHQHDTVIEPPQSNTRYWLGVAVCRTS